MLAEILDTKRRELERLRHEALPTPPALRPVDLRRSPGGPLKVIAEIKRRSPSAGDLSRVLGVAARAQAYERAGAHMLSVLCDETFFAGAYAHLVEARAATSLPLLCKEFVIDERQLDAARAYGADAVLLIVRCLEPARLATLLRACAERGLVALTEIHGLQETRIALDAGATLIGVNARDLDTLQLDTKLAEQVLESLPGHVTALHLSGIRDERQIAAVAGSRADAALIGECLMREDDPEPLLRRLVAAAAR
ncbi:MAG TPA: indole-3-glycerol-phosphate synthase [Polyangiaceae bacterium]|nr:indole-3-glycerol-phosphate synthase [Polyangiaceae bacterium]